MKRGIKRLLFTLLIISFILIGCSKDKPIKKENIQITIGAAASLENAMEEIQDLFSKKYPHITTTFTYGSSGSLAQQIEQGAPIDVFVSAAVKQMDELKAKELIIDDTERTILENKVVLIVPNSSKLNIMGFEDILKASKIALGDPDFVPAGQYAKEIFTYLNIFDEVSKKATFGKDVSEVLTWVSTGNVDAGVVYETDALANKDVIIAAKAPEGSYSKVIYPTAVVKNTKKEKASTDFVQYLLSEEAKEVFIKYGFTPIE